MPRIFSDTEREAIRETLLRNGRELFARYGIRKTSIEELTKGAGISLGSFYSFYGSKEELFFDVMEQEEKAREGFFEELLSFRTLTSDRLVAFLEGAFDFMEGNPIIRRLYEDGEYDLLVRKLPPERVEAHIRKDSEFAKQLIQSWQKAGFLKEEDPDLIAALFRALFLITFHKQEIGAEEYPRVRRMLLELVAEGLVNEGEKE